MTAEVMRNIGVLACATTLSLFTTIVAYAATNVSTLKWDGSFCTINECGRTLAMRNDASRSGARPTKVSAAS